MKDKKIKIVACGHFEKNVLDQVSSDLAYVYHSKTLVLECSMDINDCYNPGRKQYDANKILDIMRGRKDTAFDKTIGLVRVDLFIPILTYIFGQAVLNGDIGIASLYRLRNELYGLNQDNAILIERFRKVIIHEIGHLFGLIHCMNPECVMRSSTYVEDLDQKKFNLCSSCQKKFSQ